MRLLDFTFALAAVFSLLCPVWSAINVTCSTVSDCDATTEICVDNTGGTPAKMCADDPCKPKPCLAGGTCTSSTAYPPRESCACKDGHGGTKCELTPKCTNSTSCNEKGTCKISAGEQSVCVCTEGYGGDNCKDAPKCSSKTECKNNGACVIKTGLQSVCNCTTGWKGDTCQTDAKSKSSSVSEAFTTMFMLVILTLIFS